MSQIVYCTECGLKLGLIKHGKAELRNGELHEHPGKPAEIHCPCGKVNVVN